MTEENNKLIIFFGSIGVGKTTLGIQMEKTFKNVKFIMEDLNENPFIDCFYKDMKKWGFHSSVAMLGMMSSFPQKLDKTKNITILDNGIEELIAYTNLEYEKYIITDQEFSVYKKIYDNFVKLLPKPDLYVYLCCDTKLSLQRIRKRNRLFEQELDLNFINDLNRHYKEFIKTIPSENLLVVDTTNYVDPIELANLISNRVQCKFKLVSC